MTLQQIIDAAEAAKTGGAANLGATPELVWELLQALAQNGGGGGGVSVFTGLTDVPNTYVSQAGKIVSVKGNETGLEFISAAGGNTLYTGDGTLSGNRIVHGDNRTLDFNEGASFGVNAGNITLAASAFNGVLTLQTTDVGTSIIMDDATQSITYTAPAFSGTGGHIFTGNVGIGVAPSAAQLFVVNDGTNNLLIIDKTNFKSELYATDVTNFSALQLRASTGAQQFFDLYSTDGANQVDILGDAIAQTITLTAANGIIFSNQARLKNYTVATLPAGTAGDIAYVTDALLPTFLATVAGSGAVVTPVFYDGTSWKTF